mmetsp:Transcript_15793/g.40618  ORF Transcript_15793/g.40618 Transcript_15793/m.40618 type:complete len:239 (+) Transcript_15793:386-1102(+)
MHPRLPAPTDAAATRALAGWVALGELTVRQRLDAVAAFEVGTKSPELLRGLVVADELALLLLFRLLPLRLLFLGFLLLIILLAAPAFASTAASVFASTAASGHGTRAALAGVGVGWAKRPPGQLGLRARPERLLLLQALQLLDGLLCRLDARRHVPRQPFVAIEGKLQHGAVCGVHGRPTCGPRAAAAGGRRTPRGIGASKLGIAEEEPEKRDEDQSDERGDELPLTRPHNPPVMPRT